MGFLGSLVIVIAHQFFTPKEISGTGGYFLTNYLQQNYHWIWFALSGFIIGCITTEDPIIVGISMVLVFPIASLLEIVHNSNSHNMLPMELITWVIYSMPTVIGAWLGKMLSEKIIQRHLTSRSH